MRARDVLLQTRLDARLWIRNGEQLLLLVFLPVLGLSLGLDRAELLGLERGAFARGVIGLSLFGAAFTGQAILTAFDRRAAALTVIGAGPLGRRGLLLSRTLLTLIVASVQLLVLSALALARGLALADVLPAAWHLLALPVYVGAALAFAGTLRAERVLALANVIVVLVGVVGGPLQQVDVITGDPRWVLPTAATTLVAEGVAGPLHFAVIAVWTIVAWTIVARRFAWSD